MLIMPFLAADVLAGGYPAIVEGLDIRIK
jgi:hypothetical protein